MKKTYLWTAMLCTAIAFSACKSNKAGQALPDTYGVK